MPSSSTAATPLRALILVLCACWPLSAPRAQAPAPAAPAGPLYSVEVVIFRDSSVGQAEDWSAQPTARGFGPAGAVAGPPPQVVRVLAPGDYRLNGIESGLRSSGAWRPIAHAAWIQSASTWGQHAGIALSDLGVNAPELSGMVFLERAKVYLHLGFELKLNAGATYTIDEMRSVRYNDKLYFDHPAFGIIAVVTPIKRAG